MKFDDQDFSADELDQLSESLARYANEKPVTPSRGLKSRIMMDLSRLSAQETYNLTDLPLLNAYADVDIWQRTVATIQPPADHQRNLFTHVLRQDESVTQFLVWIRREIRPEDHHDEHESFLILEGTCTCSIGGEQVDLGPGDYLAVPLDLEHTVRVTSDIPVKTIIQRVKAA